MERVAFLVEQTGQRLACLLNPESLVVRRSAGVRTRSASRRPLAGADLSDDPLLYTGGGTTTLELDLLFDVSLAGSSVPTDDVRQLTAPLWQLAENAGAGQGYGRPPLVHFVWGKSWSVPGIVVAVAERLESFTPEGAPQRSWLRMRLRRVNESPTARPQAQAPLPSIDPSLLEDAELAPADIAAHELAGEGTTVEGEPATAGERLDQVAYRWFGNPAYWHLLAQVNDLADPLRLEAGQVLRVPSLAPPEASP